MTFFDSSVPDYLIHINGLRRARLIEMLSRISATSSRSDDVRLGDRMPSFCGRSRRFAVTISARLEEFAAMHKGPPAQVFEYQFDND